MRGEALIFGAISLGLGALLVYGAAVLPASRTADIGAGRIPLLVGIAAVVLSTVVIYQAIRGSGLDRGEGQTRLGSAALMAGTVVYLAAINLFGYFLASAIMIAAVIYFLERASKLVMAVGSAAAFCIGVYTIFDLIIDIPFP